MLAGGGSAPVAAWRPATGGVTAGKGANARGVFRCVRGLQGPAVRQPAPTVAFAAGAVATCGALRRDEVVAILGGMDIRRN